MAVCVECGRQSEQQLFKRYTGGAIQLMQCENCHKVIDKYVEFDTVILLLDVLLLRIQSYRHLIYNYDITSSVLWKLSLVLVLCEAYTKLRRLGLENSNAVVLQVNFHSFFIQSIFEMMILFLLSYALLWTASILPLQFMNVFRMLVLSSYGKLSAIAAMIWTGDFYLWLPLLLVIPSQFLAICATLQEVSAIRAGVMVLVLNVVVHGVSFLLDMQRTAVVKHLLDGTY